MSTLCLPFASCGLLDINMPILYGEGKKAFHRLQLEIIRSSNDQSIFAWGSLVGSSSVRIGSILADDPSDFEDCLLFYYVARHERVNRTLSLRERKN